jgi:hypothetical protein
MWKFIKRADGRRYEGGWKNGKQHGKAKYFLPDGTLHVGVWEDGKRLKWVDDEEKRAENK